MAQNIALSVRYAFMRSGFVDYRTGGTAPVTHDLPTERINYRAYTDPADAAVYSIVFHTPVAGIREDYYCEETVAEILEAANA